VISGYRKKDLFAFETILANNWVNKVTSLWTYYILKGQISVVFARKYNFCYPSAYSNHGSFKRHTYDPSYWYIYLYWSVAITTVCKIVCVFKAVILTFSKSLLNKSCLFYLKFDRILFTFYDAYMNVWQFQVHDVFSSSFCSWVFSGSERRCILQPNA